MIAKSDWCLVIGAGSIGERYIRNLWAMGYKNTLVLRSRNLPFRDIGEARVEVTTSWDRVDQLNPRVAFVCTPTALHLENAVECVRRGIHVLVEKPLSNSTHGLKQLAKLAVEKQVLVQVGYMMRYHPFIRKVYSMSQSSRFGSLLHIQSYWGEYLPDWHPWEDYRRSYAALRSLGGGSALTLSHDLDLSNWIAGVEIERFHRIDNYRSSLEVDVESGSDFLVHYRNGVTANIHQNYFQKVKERYYKYIFENAVVRINYFSNEMITSTADGESVELLERFDRNDLFIDEIDAFFKALNTPEDSTANIAESEQIIKMCTDNV